LEKKDLSHRTRAWKLITSLKWALVIGGLAGVLAIGMLYNQAVGNLDSRGAVLAGAGAGAVLTALLTYVLDQVSQTVGRLRPARRKRGSGNPSERKGQN
jgi:hypothetical protein